MRSRNLALALSLFFVMVFAAPQMASASTITVVGDPFYIGSWSQAFNETGVTFDKMELFSTSGATFEPPAMTGLASGWSNFYVNPTYSFATGPASTNMTFNINFLGDQSAPLSFDFLASYNNVVVERDQAIWSGSGFVITTLSPNDGGTYDRTPVPEPASMTLLATGLFGLAAAARRRLRRS